MDSEEDLKSGVVRLVTSPPRTLRRGEEEPRPYEIGWVQEQIDRKKLEALRPSPRIWQR